jgi:hypothetical protein
MLLRHATPARNLPSIRRSGLLTSKSRGRLPVVWLHARSKTAWAALHTVKRHGGRVEGVIVLELDVPRRWLRRNRRGLWYCAKDIRPGRFRRLISFAELAGPSADERASQLGPLALAAG